MLPSVVHPRREDVALEHAVEEAAVARHRMSVGQTCRTSMKNLNSVTSTRKALPLIHSRLALGVVDAAIEAGVAGVAAADPSLNSNDVQTW